jgi:hypothetical protein
MGLFSRRAAARRDFLFGHFFKALFVPKATDMRCPAVTLHGFNIDLTKHCFRGLDFCDKVSLCK